MQPSICGEFSIEKKSPNIVEMLGLFMMTCEGFEPTTPSLSRKCSPTELTSHIELNYISNYIKFYDNVNSLVY
jgi:hypothetical protein